MVRCLLTMGLVLLFGLVTGAHAPALAGLESRINQSQAQMEATRLSLLSFDQETALAQMGMAQASLAEAQDAFASGDEDNGYFHLMQGQRALDRFHLAIQPDRAVETRGMWVDDVILGRMHSRQDIQKMLDEYARINIQVLYPDIYHHGYSFYPSSIAIWDPKWSLYWGDEDPLAVLIEEAHLRGMEVHAWFRVFSAGTTSELLLQNVDWAQRTQSGRLNNSNGRYWFDSAHPGVRDYIISVMEEVMERYPIDGVHLDYIRSDDELQYGRASTDLFMAFHGIRPQELKPGTPLFNQWKLMQEEFVTSFVRRVQQVMRERRPELVLSAAVASAYSWGKNDLRQDWKNWAENGFIDLLTPMSYRGTAQAMETLVPSEMRNAGDAPAHIGLGVYLFDAKVLLEQVAVIRGHQAPGMTIFSGANMKHDMYTYLAQGPFRKPSFPTHHQPELAARLVLEDLAERIALGAPSGMDWEGILEKIEGILVEWESTSRQERRQFLVSWGDEILLEARRGSLPELPARTIGGELRYAAALLGHSLYQTEPKEFVPLQ